jgi:glycosyltransferase involved in cell wall biosynthesis
LLKFFKHMAAAAAICWLADHPEEAMGHRRARLVRECYNWRSQASRLVNLYRRLLAPTTATSE